MSIKSLKKKQVSYLTGKIQLMDGEFYSIQPDERKRQNEATNEISWACELSATILGKENLFAIGCCHSADVIKFTGLRSAD